MFHFYTPWKRQKNRGFFTFSGGVEMERRLKMGQLRVQKKKKQLRVNGDVY